MSIRVPSPVEMPCEDQSELSVQPQLEQAITFADDMNISKATDVAKRLF